VSIAARARTAEKPAIGAGNARMIVYSAGCAEFTALTFTFCGSGKIMSTEAPAHLESLAARIIAIRDSL